MEEILGNQSLSEDSEELKALKAEREKVEKILRDSFKKSSPTIKYGGSKAKGTMIKDSYDLDIICYFQHNDNEAGESLEEIYNNVKKALTAQYLVVPKSSALRLESNDSQKKGFIFILMSSRDVLQMKARKTHFCIKTTDKKKDRKQIYKSILIM